MNMQQMLMQAQKMQRELRKAKEALYEKEFTLSKSGLVTVIMYGNKEIKSIDIDKDAIEPDNKEMIEDTIAACVNELIEKINDEEDEIEEKITGKSGMGF
ncbi:MAG: YbaB/EbfC family nucleoid-associated protein [Bacilli bacterium]|nr:YbaB/EbfC family nucleoid-associated protein [Bacilli bacterium]